MHTTPIQGKKRRHLGRTWTVVAGLVVLAAACGTDGETSIDQTVATTGTTPSPPSTTATSTTAAEPDTDRIDPSVFDYDAAADVNYEEDPEALDLPVPNVDIHPFTYDSPHGGQVTGYVAHPPEGESDAAILLMHGMPDGADDYIEPMAFLSCTGATVLAIDAPYVRTGRVEMPLTFTEGDRDEQIQLIVDLRRAVDLLETLGAERITFDGVSWGAAIGALLAGVEPRVNGYALMMGGPIVDFFIKDGTPIAPLAGQPEHVIDEWVEVMSRVDPTRFVGEATTSILFQNGRNDTFVTPQSAGRLHEAAGPGHEVRWYDDAHDPSPELLDEHINWQTDILGLDADRVAECIAPAVGQ